MVYKVIIVESWVERLSTERCAHEDVESINTGGGKIVSQVATRTTCH